MGFHFASRNNASALKRSGRRPKNSPLGCFLNGLPPHRFESPASAPDMKRPPLPRALQLRGGDDGIRTHDPHVANVMLSQLSYIPTYGRADAQFGILPFGTAFVKEGGSPSLIEHAGGARLAPP